MNTLSNVRNRDGRVTDVSGTFGEDRRPKVDPVRKRGKKGAAEKDPDPVVEMANDVQYIPLLWDKTIRGEVSDLLWLGLSVSESGECFRIELFIHSYESGTIPLDSSVVFRVKTKFWVEEGKLVLRERMEELTTAKPIVFDVSNKFLKEREDLKWAIELIPFEFQHVDDCDLLAYLLFMSFSQVVPQIREYNREWPIMSWIRQSMTSKDADVAQIFEHARDGHDIDLDDFSTGLRCARRRVERQDKLYEAIFQPGAFSCDLERNGVNGRDLYTLMESFTRKLANECGYSYKVLPMAPFCHLRLGVEQPPHLLAFVPVLSDPSYYVSELICAKQFYLLYAVVREEEGKYTATYFSPGTWKYYDYRDEELTEIKQRPPPVCNAREQYVFFLFVRGDLFDYFSRFQPMLPFRKQVPTRKMKYYQVCGKKVVPYKPQESDVKQGSSVLYFPYDEKLQPYPSVPLSCVCGESVLVWKEYNSRNVPRPCLVWVRDRDGVHPDLRDAAAVLESNAGLASSSKVCAVIRDNRCVQIVSNETHVPVDSLFEFPIEGQCKDDFCLFAVHVAEPRGTSWAYNKRDDLKDTLPRFIKVGPVAAGFEKSFDDLRRMVPNGAKLFMFVDGRSGYFQIRDAGSLKMAYDVAHNNPISFREILAVV